MQHTWKLFWFNVAKQNLLPSILWTLPANPLPTELLKQNRVPSQFLSQSSNYPQVHVTLWARRRSRERLGWGMLNPKTQSINENNQSKEKFVALYVHAYIHIACMWHAYTCAYTFTHAHARLYTYTHTHVEMYTHSITLKFPDFSVPQVSLILIKVSLSLDCSFFSSYSYSPGLWSERLMSLVAQWYKFSTFHGSWDIAVSNFKFARIKLQN